MDYLPDLAFVRGTASFRHLQELTPVKILFVTNACRLGPEHGMGEARHPAWTGTENVLHPANAEGMWEKLQHGEDICAQRLSQTRGFRCWNSGVLSVASAAQACWESTERPLRQRARHRLPVLS